MAASLTDPYAIQHVRDIAEARLAQLLLARFYMLNYLIEVAKSLPGGLDEKSHRRLWTFLQAKPNIIPVSTTGDIFTELAHHLRGLTNKDLKERIRKEYARFGELTIGRTDAYKKESTPTLFCVLDEAQTTTTLRMGEFRGADDKTPRPILREIWRLWTWVLDFNQMRLVLSGTGITVNEIDDVLASNPLKLAPKFRWTELGAFDTPESQEYFIKQYIPARWDEPAWDAFLRRAWRWVRGRYRLTAFLVSLILEGGYSSPHRTLDSMVEAVSGIRLTDLALWIMKEPELKLVIKPYRAIKFNFHKMSQPHREIVFDAIVEQLLYGSYVLNWIIPDVEKFFIEIGFGRYRIVETLEGHMEKLVLNEPIPVFAALTSFKKWIPGSLFAHLRREIDKNVPSRNGFAAYLAFYLREVFKDAKELGGVFSFRSDFARQQHAREAAWPDRRFKLVSVSRREGEPNPHVSATTPYSWASPNLGVQEDSVEGVLDWVMTNSNGYTFCFPPSSMGPDILFFLQSESSGELLLVALQAKGYEKVEKEALIHGINSVSPDYFWKSKNEEERIIWKSPYIVKKTERRAADRFMKALKTIPSAAEIPGAVYPILRVFASAPVPANLERTLPVSTRRGTLRGTITELLTGHNPENQPVACLNMKTFDEVGKKFTDQWLRGQTESSLLSREH
ncbi:hypothetical protein CPB86DRAFT_872254 [Serendipita vermifera]|nr:hypothetical protein CPB86DRAFT_872254 [Serendipita vermifera]